MEVICLTPCTEDSAPSTFRVISVSIVASNEAHNLPRCLDSVRGWVAEIVVDATRDSGRDRYKFYRDRGFPLFDHHLDDWEAA